MKILKKVNTEFGSAWFFNSSVATDSTVVAVMISPENKFQVGVISEEDYSELSVASDDDVIFGFPQRCISSCKMMEGVINPDSTFSLSSSGSLGQEDFEFTGLKTEIVALTIALELAVKVDKVFKPFTLNHERVTDAYINKKVILNDTGSGFTSGFSGKTYNFTLDPKYKDMDYIHNWLVTCDGEEDNQVWIAPIKCYILSGKRDHDVTSLEELWDVWLIKQYATKMSLQNLPSEWVTSGYHKLLFTYLDEVIFA